MSKRKEKIYEPKSSLLRYVVLHWLAIRAGVNGYRSFINTFREHTGEQSESRSPFRRVLLGAGAILLMVGIVAFAARSCSRSAFRDDEQSHVIGAVRERSDRIESAANGIIGSTAAARRSTAEADRIVVEASRVLEDIMHHSKRCVFDGTRIIFPDLQVVYELILVEDNDERDRYFRTDESE
jgi:hypothetical protein